MLPALQTAWFARKEKSARGVHTRGLVKVVACGCLPGHICLICTICSSSSDPAAAELLRSGSCLQLKLRCWKAPFSQQLLLKHMHLSVLKLPATHLLSIAELVSISRLLGKCTTAVQQDQLRSQRCVIYMINVFLHLRQFPHNTRQHASCFA